MVDAVLDLVASVALHSLASEECCTMEVDHGIVDDTETAVLEDRLDEDLAEAGDHWDENLVVAVEMVDSSVETIH